MHSVNNHSTRPCAPAQLARCASHANTVICRHDPFPSCQGNATARATSHLSASTSSRSVLHSPETDDSIGAAFTKIAQKRSGQPACLGTVYLVGTGPGDPGLLTLRALQLMQSADVVLYDRLVSPEILELIHGGAVMVYVGKEQGFHTRSQEEIHALMAQFADTGATVLRLKGGDPFVFGRGGEEQQYLQSRGIRTIAVPGITAASGIAAELGIPLTHRGLATSVRYLTGHAREGGEGQLKETTHVVGAEPHTTLVVYMGLSTLPELVREVLQQGMCPCTPAVAVERGTTPEQRLVFAQLQDFQRHVQEAKLRSPTLLIIGEVVALSPGWHVYQQTGQFLQEPGSTSLQAPYTFGEFLSVHQFSSDVHGSLQSV